MTLTRFEKVFIVFAVTFFPSVVFILLFQSKLAMIVNIKIFIAALVLSVFSWYYFRNAENKNTFWDFFMQYRDMKQEYTRFKDKIRSLEEIMVFFILCLFGSLFFFGYTLYFFFISNYARFALTLLFFCVFLFMFVKLKGDVKKEKDFFLEDVRSFDKKKR